MESFSLVAIQSNWITTHNILKNASKTQRHHINDTNLVNLSLTNITSIKYGMNEKINYFLFLFRIIKNKLMFALSKQKKSFF